VEKLKKIIFTVTNDISFDQRMARICSTLSNAGYDVEIVGRKRKNTVLLISREYKETRLNCFFQKGKFFYLEFNVRLFFYLLFKDVDVISSVDLDTLLACTFTAKIRSKKLVFDAHEYFTEVPEVTDRKLIKKIWEMVAKWCIPHVDSAYTVGESLAEIFALQYHKKFEVARNTPLLVNNQEADQITDKRIILYQGDINEGRGLEQMIEAMVDIDADFWIAGDGLLMNKLKELTLHFNVGDKLKFLGYVRPEELKEITLKAYIGINLLQNKGLSYYYSLANKFFDYMHAGVPQVCAPFPEYEKINSQFNIALLCECDVAQIKNTLKCLLEDAALYKRLHSECSRAGEVFNWQTEQQKIVKIYTDVCK
jgi:glycosyltransferase involved in cell wall biosynthesis